jgi:hypothetical protein
MHYVYCWSLDYLATTNNCQSMVLAVCADLLQHPQASEKLWDIEKKWLGYKIESGWRFFSKPVARVRMKADGCSREQLKEHFKRWDMQCAATGLTERWIFLSNKWGNRRKLHDDLTTTKHPIDTMFKAWFRRSLYFQFQYLAYLNPIPYIVEEIDSEGKRTILMVPLKDSSNQGSGNQGSSNQDSSNKDASSKESSNRSVNRLMILLFPLAALGGAFFCSNDIMLEILAHPSDIACAFGRGIKAFVLCDKDGMTFDKSMQSQTVLDSDKSVGQTLLADSANIEPSNLLIHPPLTAQQSNRTEYLETMVQPSRQVEPHELDDHQHGQAEQHASERQQTMPDGEEMPQSQQEASTSKVHACSSPPRSAKTNCKKKIKATTQCFKELWDGDAPWDEVLDAWKLMRHANALDYKTAKDQSRKDRKKRAEEWESGTMNRPTRQQRRADRNVKWSGGLSLSCGLTLGFAAVVAALASCC